MDCFKVAILAKDVFEDCNIKDNVYTVCVHNMYIYSIETRNWPRLLTYLRGRGDGVVGVDDRDDIQGHQLSEKQK